MNRFATVLAACVVAVAFGCSQSEPPAPTAEAPAEKPAAVAPEAEASHAATPVAPTEMVGKVLETMDSGGYTYVKIDNGAEPVWAAAPKFVVQVGDDVIVNGPMPMPGYKSKTLDRTFEMIYFASSIVGPGSAGAAIPAAGAAPAAGGHPGGPIKTDAGNVDLTGIAKVEGGQTVGELWEKKSDFDGKSVKVRGKVVKFMGGIMGKNWVHVRDGSGDEGTNDLTVTTDGTAAVGDTVVVSGNVTLDKDFGYGYKYALIIEDGKVEAE